MKMIALGSSHTSDCELRIASPFPNEQLLRKKKNSAPGRTIFHWETGWRFVVQNLMCGISRWRSFTQRNGYYFSKSHNLQIFTFTLILMWDEEVG